MDKKEPRVVIMSRTHDQDISGRIIESGARYGRLSTRYPTIQVGETREWDGRSPISMGVANSSGNVWPSFEALQRSMEERKIIEAFIPWLDGAREHLMCLAVWADGQ